MSRNVRKHIPGHVHSSKIQISLLSLIRNFTGCMLDCQEWNVFYADYEDSNQISLIFVARTCQEVRFLTLQKETNLLRLT